MNDAGGMRLILGDCLERMGEIEAGSVDLIAADLPYGTTACKWDVVIPFEPLWAHYRRILKPRGAVVLTASQPFTSMLVMSNLRWFKYTLVWEKEVASNFLNSKYQPLKVHEDIAVFSPAAATYSPNDGMTYRPQMDRRRPISGGVGVSKSDYKFHSAPAENTRRKADTCYPRSVLRFNREMGLHASQKPVALFEYIIKTYSNPGDLVLDNAMGSGTTGIACLNTDRRFIGIEKDEAIFATAERRIADHLAATPLLTG